MHRILLTIIMVCVIASGAKAAENAVIPGEFVVERPTIKSLGFEWKITGDDNRNSAVDVTYRKTGDKGTGRKRYPCSGWGANS